MRSNDENALLRRVDRTRPMGQRMRRFRQPIRLSKEVSGPDAVPVKLRKLGADWAVFREAERQRRRALCKVPASPRFTGLRSQ